MIKHLQQRFELLRIQPFKWFVLSCLFSTFGNGLSYIALTWIVLDHGHGLGAVALLMTLAWLPMFFLSPLAGVIADRYSRKKIVIISNLSRGLFMIIFIVLFKGHLNNLLVYLLSFILSIMGSLYGPASMALVREVVPAEKLLSANATVDMAYELGNILGMSSAGIIIALSSSATTIIINGFAFLLGVICMYFMRETHKKRADLNQSTYWQDLRDGLAYLAKRKFLRIIYCLQLFVLCSFMTAPILLAPFARNVLHTTAGQFGLIEAFLSVGMVLGNIILPYVAEKVGFNIAIYASIIVLTACFTSMSWVQTISTTAVLYLIIGFFYASWALILTRAQSLTALNFQGRVQSTFTSLSGALILLTYLSLNWISHSISIRHIYWIQVGFFIICFLLLLTSHKYAASKQTATD